MRWILAGLFMMWGQVALAQQSDIEATIDRQITAFGAGDFEEAFSYASPSIQGIFGSADRFELMVRSGYPMVVDPQELRYLDLTGNGRIYWQKVLIRDQSGKTHYLGYQMIEIDGVWRINGVQFLEPDPSA